MYAYHICKIEYLFSAQYVVEGMWDRWSSAAGLNSEEDEPDLREIHDSVIKT